MKKSIDRINTVREHLNDKEVMWVMSLLTLPKLQTIIMNSDDAMEFMKRKNKERTVH